MKTTVHHGIVRLAFLAGAFCTMAHAATVVHLASGATATHDPHFGWMVGLGIVALALPAKRRHNS